MGIGSLLMRVQSSLAPADTCTYRVHCGGESALCTHPLHLCTATRGFEVSGSLQPAPKHHLRQRRPARWQVRQPASGSKRRGSRVAAKRVVSGCSAGEGVRHRRTNARLGGECSGRAGPRAGSSSAAMCAGKKIVSGFDRIITHHQKLTARLRRKILAGLARAERAQGGEAVARAAHGQSQGSGWRVGTQRVMQ